VEKCYNYVCRKVIILRDDSLIQGYFSMGSKRQTEIFNPDENDFK
jgi:hypothetical protein